MGQSFVFSFPPLCEQPSRTVSKRQDLVQEPSQILLYKRGSVNVRVQVGSGEEQMGSEREVNKEGLMLCFRKTYWSERIDQ